MKTLPFAALTALMLLTFSFPALAYVGPGGGLTAIGALIALIGVVLYTFFGFIWFPLKRLFKKMRGGTEQTTQTSETAQKEAEPSSTDTVQPQPPENK